MQTSKEDFTTMADAKFDRGRGGGGGQTGCIMGNWKIENLLSSDDMDDVISRFFFLQSARQCDKKKVVPWLENMDFFLIL